MATRSPYDLSRTDWEPILADIAGKKAPKFRIDQLWRALYERGETIDKVSELPQAWRDRLSEQVAPQLEAAAVQRSANGDTVKRLWRCCDGATIESVLMHYKERSTVCISSQAGCAMGCTFCATGQMGYARHLSVGEILEQVVAARTEAQPRRLSNIVYMGMGEPLANFDAVAESLHRVIDDLGIGARKITVSTVGLVPQIYRFADLQLQVGLAISLHAANDTLRSTMVPINEQHPIADLVEAARYFRSTTGRRVSFEWAMIDGVNDRPSDSAELAAVARAAHAHVNLIPLNPTPGYPTVGSPVDRIRRFAADLTANGVNATVRQNRGTDIDAACGQLRATIEAKQQRRNEVPIELRRS